MYLGKGRPREAGRGIPDATVARLPVYHRVLVSLSEAGVQTVSSEALAAKCGVSSAKFRKDLSYLGSYGTRGVGYDVSYLTYHISRELGSAQPWGVVIVGVGNLGRALISYRGFTSRGFAIVGLVDNHPDVVGECIAASELGNLVALTVRPLVELETIVGAT
ncbi:MAG: redox-sensing transcriptional repressor Rex, partial [Actinobacteria bacterium]|nr:redox-sensing transcriptional repressor Rex [Actinomycetota bacterium]